MNAIQEPNNKFDFQKLVLSPPMSVSSGNHFIKYSCNESPLYIQTPKCKNKQGTVKAGKKMFCDLMFSIENEDFTHWLENLENYSQQYIFEKREKWFETSLEKHDIENSFTSPIRLIKSGKFYILRVNIPMILGKSSLKIYNESEELMEFEDIKEDSHIISILEFQGIKCSPRGFQIEIEMKQLLVLNPVDIFQKCILLNSNSNKNDGVFGERGQIAKLSTTNFEDNQRSSEKFGQGSFGTQQLTQKGATHPDEFASEDKLKILENIHIEEYTTASSSDRLREPLMDDASFDQRAKLSTTNFKDDQ